MAKDLTQTIQKKNLLPKSYTEYGITYPTGLLTEDIQRNRYFNLVRRNMVAKLRNIILKMYKWKLPEGMDERYIEKGFLERGWITVFKSPLGNFALPSFPNNMYNIYEQPTQMQVLGYNGWTEVVNIKYFKEYPQSPNIKMIPAKEGYVGVCERDNWDEHIYMDDVMEYAFILADNIISLYVASNRLKDPYILAIYDKSMGKNAKKLVSNIKNNNPDILVVKEDSKSLNNTNIKDMIEKVDLQGNPESCKKLTEVYNFNINRFLETIGINVNPDPDKTQYVNDSQVNTNNSLIDIENDVRFLPRQELCRKAKELLGIEMSVEKNVVEVSKLVNQLRKDGQVDEPVEEISEDSK